MKCNNNYYWIYVVFLLINAFSSTHIFHEETIFYRFLQIKPSGSVLFQFTIFFVQLCSLGTTSDFLFYIMNLRTKMLQAQHKENNFIRISPQLYKIHILVIYEQMKDGNLEKNMSSTLTGEHYFSNSRSLKVQYNYCLRKISLRHTPF